MDQERDIPNLRQHGDKSPSDRFFENFIDICNESSYENSVIYADPVTIFEVANEYFVDFLKGCQWYYMTFSMDKPKELHNYFKYILNRFLHVKGTLFSERGGKIMHIGLPNPVSMDSEKEYKCAYYYYDCINKAISILDDYIKQLTPIEKNSPPPPPPPPKIHGFRIKNKDCLDSVFRKLRFLIIHQDVKYQDFEAAFTGWIPKNKIIWIKGPGLLSYFIKSINSKGIEDEKKNIWNTTIYCFQDENLKDFTSDQLRFAKKPTKTEDVDLVIKAINRYSGEEY